MERPSPSHKAGGKPILLTRPAAGRFHVAVCAFRSSAKISKISEALLVMLKSVPHPRKNVSDPILERIAALPVASHSDRKSVVEGKSVSERVDRGGGGLIKKKKKNRD